MYGEAQLSGEWFPARIFELENNLIQATIISSVKAQKHNIIGIDVTMDKKRANLLEEPESLQSLQKVVPYGNLHKKKRHQRHVSAIPEEDTVSGIDPNQAYPGITPNQIDELDRCLAKFIQRASKFDVTWRKTRDNKQFRCTTYIQDCSDGTSRVMTRGLCRASFELFKEIFEASQPQEYALYSKSTEILQTYGEDMCIKRRFDSYPGGFGFYSDRENIFYEWKLQRDDTYFVLWSSLEVDDETGHGKLDPSSSHVRSITNPGTGWAFSKQGDEVQYIIMRHINPGGWLSRSSVLETMQEYCEETWTSFCDEVQQKHMSTQISSATGTNEATAVVTDIVGDIFAKYS